MFVHPLQVRKVVEIRVHRLEKDMKVVKKLLKKLLKREARRMDRTAKTKLHGVHRSFTVKLLLIPQVSPEQTEGECPPMLDPSIDASVSERFVRIY